MSDVVSVEEISARLGISRDLVYDGLRRGEIPGLRIGRRIIVPRSRFDRWLAGDADGD